jgi:hypothetical protein
MGSAPAVLAALPASSNETILIVAPPWAPSGAALVEGLRAGGAPLAATDDGRIAAFERSPGFRARDVLILPSPSFPLCSQPAEKELRS